MPSIVIRLDPGRLAEPNLDLRYEIPDLLVQRSGGLIEDDGYDYEMPPSQAMQIYLKVASLEAALPLVIAVLENEPLHGNRLADGATLGTSERDAVDTAAFEIVYPSGERGLIESPGR